MSMSQVDYVAKVKKFREITEISHESIPSNTVADLLEKIAKFLQDHETPTPNDCTHTVFDNCTDWWQSQKSTFKLAIAEDNTLDLFYRHIGSCYDLGIPLFLTEKRTPEIRLVQDVQIWGNKSATLTAKDLMLPDCKFARLLGKTMGEMFPQEEFLDVAVFDGSGLSKTKGVMKTSLHLVWSKLVVNKEGADRIRDYVVHKFKECKDAEIKALESQIREENKDLAKNNEWSNIFNDGIYFGRYGIRMPLCDRVSPPPLQKPESRPFAPFGVLRFNFERNGNEGTPEVEQICGADELDRSEWLKIGCVRRPAGEPLTPWSQPVWKGERAPRTVDTACTTPMGGPGGGGAGAGDHDRGGGLAGRSPGQVKIRTRGGSEPTTRPRPRDPQRAAESERMQTCEREFDGTVDQFQEALEKQLGPAEDIVKEEDKLTWTSAGQMGAKVEFRAGNKRVYIMGKAHQIRSLLMVISPFVKGVGDKGARSEASSARARSQGGSEAGSMAPSLVYAPVLVPSTVGAGSSASRGLGRDPGVVGTLEHTKRVACRVFEAQGAGELGLAVGDHITVTHDPEDGTQNNVHRWVYGIKDGTEERGWFPLSHSNQLQVPHAAEEEQA